jgi:hypothetical protein
MQRSKDQYEGLKCNDFSVQQVSATYPCSTSPGTSCSLHFLFCFRIIIIASRPCFFCLSSPEVNGRMLSNHPKAFESRSDQGEADRISPTTTTVSAHDSYSISSLWSISHSQSSSTPAEREKGRRGRRNGEFERLCRYLSIGNPAC